MAYYKLVGGTHQEKESGENVNYVKGDVIKSSEPLHKKFEGKFVKAMGDDIRAYKRKLILEEEARTKAEEEEARLERKLAKQAGFEGDEDDEETSSLDSDSALGEDATDEFEGAEAAGLKVFKDGKKYSIAKDDNPDRAVRNGKGLTKAEVRSYVKEHAPAEEETEEAESEE